MQHQEGGGTSVLYIGRTVLKGYGSYLTTWHDEAYGRFL
jgi:hypothetical protein